MSGYKLSSNSLNKLSKCRGLLQEVVKTAIRISEVDFAVGETERTIEQQEKLVANGKSKTMKSRHIRREEDIFGVHAVDLFAWVDGEVSWEMRHYKKIAKAMFRSAIMHGVQVEWGGHWTSLEDGPHFQLSRKDYP